MKSDTLQLLNFLLINIEDVLLSSGKSDKIIIVV